MWKMHEIREIIKLFEESSLQELKVDMEEAESKISLKKQEGRTFASYEKLESFNPALLPVAFKEASTPLVKEISRPEVQSVSVETKPAQEERQKPIDADDPSLFKIVSPMVGTFYTAPAIDADPFVKIGDKVEKTTIVCILEAMKLFNEIEAEINGEIVDVLVENGQLVEYGQPLFLVKTE
jgi:acetyl-CoA carboxylase biotin carboxyl carrier protein